MISKEENRTNNILNESNYNLWTQEIYLLLKIRRLEQHVLKEVIKKVSGKDLDDEAKKNLIPVDGKEDTFYVEGTTNEILTLDAMVKKIILNSISIDLAMSLDFISPTAYEIYNLIASLYQESNNKRIEEIKKELDALRYNPKKDGPLSTFISKMNLKFIELEKLKEKLDYQKKFEYLFIALPEELVINLNLLSCPPIWEETMKYIIDVSHLVTSKTNTTSATNQVNTKENKAYKNYTKKQNNYNYNHNRAKNPPPHSNKPNSKGWNNKKREYY